MLGDQTGPDFRQVPLRIIRKAAIEVVGKDKLKNRVAKELQPLVVPCFIPVFCGPTGVSQGLDKERRILELVTDFLCQQVHGDVKVLGNLRRGVKDVRPLLLREL